MCMHTVQRYSNSKASSNPNTLLMAPLQFTVCNLPGNLPTLDVWSV